MSLQLKLNLMITCLLFVLLSVSAFFVVKNASEDVRAEVGGDIFCVDQRVSLFRGEIYI